MKKEKRSRKPKKPTKTHKRTSHSSQVKQRVIVNVSGGSSGGGGGFIPFPQQSQQPVINFIPNSWVDTPFRTVSEKVEANDIRAVGRTAQTQTETDPNDNEYIESLKKTTQELQDEVDKAMKRRQEINRKSAETRARNKANKDKTNVIDELERRWKI